MTTQQQWDFVRKQIEAGTPHEVVRQNAIKEGYAESDIDELLALESNFETPKKDQSQHTKPAIPLTKTQKNIRRDITVLYSVFAIPLLPMSLFMLMGGWLFAFDAPIRSSLDEFVRYLFVGGVVFSPILLIASIILMRSKNLWWGLLGLPSFLLAIWVVFGWILAF